MIQAITQAMDQEMERDEKVLVFGEDVGNNGGVFRATEGLQEKYGEDRVSDTPLAESGIGGLAIGLAVQGFRPVMEIQFFGFVYEVMDSIAGQMARQRYRTGGLIDMPITVRSPFGGGVYTAELHADSLEGLVAQSPGLKVVIPSTAVDAKGLLTAAIRDDDPVIFLEHMKLYRSFREEVPEEQYEIEIGKANVTREGTDVTLIAYGYMAVAALEAAEELEAEGISAEVIDLRTVAPVDYETLVASVEKTGRFVMIQEAQRQAGIGNNVISELSQRAILSLEAPPKHVASPDTIYPFGMMEDEWLPAVYDIVDAAYEVIDF
jgi:pyruvate dehydrogenase E1 component beta subunit